MYCFGHARLVGLIKASRPLIYGPELRSDVDAERRIDDPPIHLILLKSEYTEGQVTDQSSVSTFTQNNSCQFRSDKHSRVIDQNSHWPYRQLPDL